MSEASLRGTRLARKRQHGRACLHCASGAGGRPAITAPNVDDPRYAPLTVELQVVQLHDTSSGQCRVTGTYMLERTN